MLELQLHGKELSTNERDIPIIVEVAGRTKRISLGDLRTTRIAYEFDAPGDAAIRYSIPRGMGDFDLDNIALTQTVSSARVMSSSGLWGAQTPRIEAAGSPTCTVNTATFSACGVTGTISPYHANLLAQGVGGIWTSDTTNHASFPIVITFSKPVKNVTLTIADPDFSGNDIIGGGTFVGFAFDNLPNHPTWDTKTLPVSGLTSVTLQPAPLDYVAYRDLTFTLVDTATVKDSIVITPSSGGRLAGQSMSFSAKSAKGGSLTILSWSWAGPIPGITTSPANCGTNKTCAFNVFESGKITVIGSIASVGNSQASATVTVAACATDSIEPDRNIKSPAFRKELVDELNAHPGIEGGGVTYYDPLTHTDTLVALPNIADTACISYVPDTTNLIPPKSGVFRDTIDIHTHPWHANKRISCLPNAVAGAGPSDKDWMSAYFHHHTGYIIDIDGTIWRYNSPAETDPLHPTMYVRQSDANGLSTCVSKFNY